MYLKIISAKITGQLRIAFNSILFWENNVNWEDVLTISD